MANIQYEPGIPPLNPKWQALLKAVLDNAGITKEVRISSTYRNANRQASAMYDSIQVKGLQSQRDLYNSDFNKVLDAYSNAPSQYDKNRTITLMEDTINRLGLVGAHMLTDTTNHVAFDLKPQPSIDNNIDRFLDELNKVKFVYYPPSNKERAHHIEFKGDPDTLIKKISKTPDLPYPHTPRPKNANMELSNATILNYNDRSYEELGDGVLQIGDLIFLVDPTQLAFNTQNGYQYFPTLRTQGNPKIPTMNQVKNISINLIFPNEDSINYQLLNLYAMFKRTPFVNIRNKDVSAFFKDISFDEEWISVALESIQIQSVNGFPNTLQASITILPFDYRVVSDGFKALKSMRDVQRQQAILYDDKETELLIAKSEAKLHEDSSILNESSDNNISLEINKSPDFRQSLPFRAFYQSLIAERHSVLDNLGRPVMLTDGGSFPLKEFIPTKEENYLHEYKAVNNQEPIELEYNYIPGDFRTVSKLLSNERTATQSGILTRLTNLTNILNTPQDITNAMITNFTTEGDLYKLASSRFALEFDNIVDDQLNKFGITLDRGNEKPIHNVLGLMWQSVLGSTGIRSLISAGQDLSAANKGEASIDPPSVLGFFNGVSFERNLTFQAGMRQIAEYLNKVGSEKKNKEAFSAFLVEMRQTIENELGLIEGKESILLTDEGFSVGRLPITTAKVLIDNKKDIITGWSLIFANKFTPISLLAFKYPYYQHLGSEDPTMSLSITSTSEKGDDFKASLSTLSERLYETVKIVTLTAPELITYLDSRLTIKAGTNHIFNCFGVKKVVFEASNTVNIEGQPGSWNTTINLTQANFTIAQYHDLTQVPTNEVVREEISKLLIRIDKDSNENIIVYKYTKKDGTPLSLNDILRFKFLKRYGGELSKYINDARSQGVASTKTVSVNLGRSQVVAPRNQTDATQVNNLRVTNNDKIIGMRLAEGVEKDILKNADILEEVDVDATKSINDLIITNPVFKNLLNFLISKTENLYSSKLKFFQTNIYAHHSRLHTFYSSVKKDTISSLYTDLHMDTIFIWGLFLWNIPGILANATFKTVSQETKDGIISKFDSIFDIMEQTVSSSLAQDFADKVIRDPIVYERLITPEIIGKEVFDTIEGLKTSVNVNCYGDFDLPNLPNITLGPDFYLYNSVIDDGKKQEYIREALKRYAGIGKLCAMMTLVEAKDAVGIYDQLIQRAGNIDEPIKKVINEMILGSKPPTEENIASTKKMLFDQLEAVSLITKGYDKKLLPNENTLQASAELGVYDNLDVRKLNLIKTARISVMLEIFNIYLSLDNYMKEKRNTDLNIKELDPTKKNYVTKNLTKGQSETNSADQLYRVLTYFLPKADKITTQNLLPSNAQPSDDDAGRKELIKLFDRGMALVADAKFISLPGIQNVQNFLINKIGYYIRLNTFLLDYESKGGGNALAHLDYTLIPELKFLDYWNFRAVEENKRKVQIIKTFNNSFDAKKDTTIKLFPTFKLFFIEEDKGFTHDYDDYYTQNAIQTIEIITNKNSPSTTAVVRLSNVTGALTDRASLLRETEDITKNKSKNIFLGTLDVKPGTQIIIKMGYAPFDNLLTTVFQGRIIEMNPGPVVELICQSFGAQLNHQIIAEKFGFLSSVREHGDIASAILDMIPGLEKLGKMSMWGDTGIGTFSGKNIRNKSGKTGDKFLLSNLLGSLSSMMFRIDNPRDENIYLNYSVSNSIYHHPTFDWVIYDQSVWEALREICLYHRNNVVTLRPYNMNGLSTKNAYRETLIVGDKGGYYKDTDAFGLSTLNIRDVDKAVQGWNDLKNNLNVPKPENVLVLNGDDVPGYKIGSNQSFGGLVKGSVPTYYLSTEGKELFKFLKNELNVLILVSYLLKNNDAAASDLGDLLSSIVKSDTFIPNSFDELIYIMISFSRTGFPDNYESDVYLGDKYKNLTNNVYRTNLTEADQIKMFITIIKGLKIRLGSIELHKEDYYNIKVQLENTNDKYDTNPQYRKIQKHHLITDTSDIISNNITLNTNFSNVVNVYYTGEPTIKTASLDRLDENYIQNKLKIWTVKAFGDQRDEFSRPLNSYQKNIDTNWFDTVEKTQNFFKTYSRVKSVDALKKIHKQSEEQTNIPSWDTIPSFGVVAVNLLKQETEKMYQGTIEIVGNPNIRPFDIIHLQDYTNDIHGAIEVEEVIHTFTPERGFRTVITPNLITYDRDPIQMQDVQIINQIYEFASVNRGGNTIGAIGAGLGLIYGGYAAGAAGAGTIAGAAGIGATIGGVLTAGTGVGLGLLGIAALYNGVVGSYIKTNKFLYDQMGNIMGRDCINFTSLLYKGVPYMAGFDGVDYTNLKTLMNHNVANIKDPISRYLSFGDTFLANITTDYDPSRYGILKNLFGGIPIVGDIVNDAPQGLK